MLPSLKLIIKYWDKKQSGYLYQVGSGYLFFSSVGSGSGQSQPGSGTPVSMLHEWRNLMTKLHIFVIVAIKVNLISA